LRQIDEPSRWEGRRYFVAALLAASQGGDRKPALPSDVPCAPELRALLADSRLTATADMTLTNVYTRLVALMLPKVVLREEEPGTMMDIMVSSPGPAAPPQSFNQRDQYFAAGGGGGEGRAGAGGGGGGGGGGGNFASPTSASRRTEKRRRVDKPILTCESCGKEYTSHKPYEKHIAKCVS
jgi:hypothetical protein